MNIIIHGCCGKMGRVLAETALKEQDIHILCGIDNITDTASSKLNFPVLSELRAQGLITDVIIDFSQPTALKSLFCSRLSAKHVVLTAKTENISSAKTINFFLLIFLPPIIIKKY